PLDEFLQLRLYRPLEMRDTRFNPLRIEPVPDTLGCWAGLSNDERMLARIAPTEIDPLGRHIHGWVHDENACAIGGVSGHAGLFSSARDLAVFCQMLLNGGGFADKTFIRKTTVDLFTTRQEERSSRGLGWDTPSP